MFSKNLSLFLLGILWNLIQLSIGVRSASCEKYISDASDYRLSFNGEQGSAHWGLKTKGGYYRTIRKVETLSGCFEACVKRTKCNSFTYTPMKDKCSLSKKYGATSASQVDRLSVKFCKSRNSIAGFIKRSPQLATSLISPSPDANNTSPPYSNSPSPGQEDEGPSPPPSSNSPSPAQEDEGPSPPPSSNSPSPAQEDEDEDHDKESEHEDHGESGHGEEDEDD